MPKPNKRVRKIENLFQKLSSKERKQVLSDLLNTAPEKEACKAINKTGLMTNAKLKVEYY